MPLREGATPSVDTINSGIPPQDTAAVASFFCNPYLEIKWPGHGNQLVDAMLHKANYPRRGTFFHRYGLPSEMDACTHFFRGRPFRNFLEVDNPLIIPYGTNIRLSITSDDVIHSWAVPSFGIKIDAIPGRINQAALVVLHPGVFMGQCSELCGVLHSFMPINIEAVHPDVFFEEYNFTLSSRLAEDDDYEYDEA